MTTTAATGTETLDLMRFTLKELGLKGLVRKGPPRIEVVAAEPVLDEKFTGVAVHIHFKVTHGEVVENAVARVEFEMDEVMKSTPRQFVQVLHDRAWAALKQMIVLVDSKGA